MKNKIQLLTVVLLSLFAFNIANAQGNSNNVYISSGAGINPSSISTCQGVDTFRFNVLNINVGTLNNVEITYSFPAGVSYVSSFTNTAGFTVTEINVTDPQNVVLSIGNLNPGDNPLIEIVASSNCGVVGQNLLSNYIRVDVSNNSTYDELTGSGYTPSNPSIITTSNLGIINAQFGASYSRTITLEQSGNGFLTEVLFERTYGDAYQIDSLYLVGFGEIPFTAISGAGVDTIRFTIDNAMLVAAGIADSTFDQGDQIEIEEFLTVIDCSGNNSGQAVGYWGCGGEVCEKINPLSVGILFGSFAPDLVFTYNQEDELGFIPSGAQFPVSYGCEASYKQAVLVRNVGNETATQIRFDIYEIDPQQNLLDTSAGFFWQKGVGGTPMPFDSVYIAEFWNSSTEVSNVRFGGPVPRRAIVYLNTADIEVGDSLFVHWSKITYANDWSQNSYNCTTGSQGYVIGRSRFWNMTYSDPCQQININEGFQGDDNYNYNRLVVGQGSSPVNMFAGVEGTSTFITNSGVLDGHQSISGSLGAMDSSAYMDYKFTLPAGLDYAGDPNNPADPAFQLISSDGVGIWIPDTIIYNDPVFIARYFLATNPIPSGFGYTTGTSVNISYVTNCAELPPCPAGNSSSTILKEFYVVPDTTCGNRFYLDCVQSTDPITIFCNFCDPCPVGIRYLSSDIKRSTFGVPDNNRNGLPDRYVNGVNYPSDSLNFDELAYLKYITGDSITGSYLGINNTTAGDPSPNDTVPFMEYCYGELNLPSTSFTVGSGYVRIFDASTSTWHESTSSPKVFQVGAKAYVDATVDSLLAYANMQPPLPSGFVYEQDDSVYMEITVRANAVMGETYANYDFSMLIWDSDIPFPSTNRQFSCIPPGINIRRMTQIGFDDTKVGTQSWDVNGCTPTQIYDYGHTYTGGGAWISHFPYEYRNIVSYTGWEMEVPQGYSLTTLRMDYYRQNGLNSNVNNVFYNMPFEYFAGGDSVRLLYAMDSILTGRYGDVLANQSNLMYVYPTWQASCESPSGSITSSGSRFIAEWNTEQFGDIILTTLSTGANPFYNSTNTTSKRNLTYQGPSLAIIAGSPIVDAIQKQTSWVVNFQNLAPSGRDAYNTWFYFDNTPSGGQISIDSVQLIGGAGTKYYPTSNGFFELGNLNALTTKQYRVFASFTNCDLQFVDWYAGYNCPGYFTDFTDPTLSIGGCVPLQRSLGIDPSEALLQSTVVTGVSNTDLCVDNSLVYQFTNVQTGHSYNTQVEINTPLNSLIDVLSVEYPVGGTVYPVPVNAVVFNAPSQYIISLDSIVTSLGTTGLPGPLSSGLNSFILRASFEAQCNYISGSQVEATVFGDNPCGSPATSSSAAPQTVTVNGVPEPYFINPRLSINDSSACENLTLSVNALKLGSNPIGTEDTLILTLPLGVSYVPGSLVSIRNPLPNTVPTIDTIGSLVTYQWNLPTPVAELDSIYFTIDLAVEKSITCGSQSLLVQTVVDNTAFCVSSGMNCGVKAQTGSRSLNFDIDRPTLVLSNALFESVIQSDTTELISYSVDIENTSAVKALGDTILLNVYFDADESGNYSMGDVLLSTEEITDEFLTNDVLNFNYTFTASSNQSCALLLAIFEEDNCVCSTNTTPAQTVMIFNAGVDTSTCSNIPVQIGDITLMGHTYVWSPATGLDDANISNPYVTLNNTTGADIDYHYVLATTRGSNCTSYDTVTVTVFYQPEVIVSALSDTICTNQYSTVSATTGFASYTWTHLESPLELYPDSSDIVINLSTIGSGIHRFSVEAVDPRGCVDWDTITLYILPTPTNPVSSGNQTICETDPTPTLSVTVSNGNTANWFDAQTGGNELAHATLTYTPSSLNIGQNCYWVETANVSQTCESERIQICIDVNAAPTVNAGMDDTIVGNTFYTLQGSVSGGSSNWTQILGPSVILNGSNPNAIVNLTEGFTYGFVLSATNGTCIVNDTVYIMVNPVNQPPVITEDPQTTPEDTPVEFCPSISDVDDIVADLTTGTCGGPSNGSVVPGPTANCYTYTPNANYVGTDVICTYVCDPDGLCDTVYNIITVVGLNDSILAVNDTASTTENTPVTFSVTGNDSDLDGNINTLTVDLDPSTPGTQTTFTSANGVYTVDFAGNVTFTPNTGYNGNDSIPYRVCDDGTPLPVTCDEAMIFVSITPVNNPPMVTGDDQTTPEDTPVEFCPPISDSDDALLTLTTGLCGAAMNGMVVPGPTANCFTYTPNSDFNGTETICTYVCDPSGLCDTAYTIITVLPANDPPIAINDTTTTPENTPVTLPVTFNDEDVDGNIDNLTLDLDPSSPGIQTTFTTANGTYTSDAFGNVTFTPNVGFNGVDSTSYQICDNGTPLPSLCDVAMIYVTIVAQNDPPVITSDDQTTPENTPVEFCPPIFDVDDAVSTLTTGICGGPSNGMVVSGPTTNCYTYTPNNGFSGVDVICTYVCDPSGLCDTAYTEIDVIPGNTPPMAINDTTSTNEDTPVTFSITANDTDSDGNIDDLTVDLDPSTPGTQTTFTTSNGTYTSDLVGNVTFTPNPQFSGIDSTSYFVCDDGTPLPALCDTAMIYVTVVPVNDPPVITSDNQTTDEDTPVEFCPPVSDVDDALATLTVGTCGGPSNGTVVSGPTVNCYTYTPNSNFVGVDVICTYVCDPSGLCDTVYNIITVIGVNDTIIAVNDTAYTSEDVPVTFSISANDSDLDGNVNNFTIDLDPSTPGTQTTFTTSNGTYTSDLVGNVTFTPNSGFSGVDSTPYVICDDGTPLPYTCDEAMIYVTIYPVNNPPVAINDSDTTDEDTPVTTNVLVNDTDLEGPLDTTSVAVVTNPTNGTVVVNPDGTIEYTPNPDFVGTDQYTYMVCDTGMPVLCDTAIVTIVISPSPDTIYVSVPEDSTVTVCTSTSVNFENPITGISMCGLPENGSTGSNVLPCLDYTPDPGYIGQDTMCVVTCSGSICDTTIVIITVGPVNDPPVAINDMDETDEDTPVLIDIVVNDYDLDGLIDSSSVTIVSEPTNGTITAINPDGTVEYTPDPNFVGTDQFTYSICDNGIPVLCTTAIVTVVINPVTDTISIYVPEDSIVTECIGDSLNLQGPITSMTLCDAPMNGTATPAFLPCFTYEPDPSFVGQDTMCVITCSSNVCDTTIVVITVGPVNDPPVAVDNSVTTPQDSAITINVVNNDYDLDGPIDSTSVSLVTPPTNGVITAINPDGTVEYTPNPGYTGIDQFTYAVCDTGLPVLCDTAVVTILIGATTDTTYITVPEDSNVTVCLDSLVNLGGIVDNLVSCGGPENGVVDMGLLPCINYTPNSGYVGPDTLCVITCSSGVCDTTIIVIDVTPVNDPPVAVDDVDVTDEDTPVTTNVLVNDSDLEGPLDTSSVAVVTNPEHGTVTVNPDGTITYTPESDFTGTDQYTYAVCDTGMPVLCDTAVVTITINPQADTVYTSVPEDSMINLCTTSSTNFENPITSISLCGGPDNGTATPSFLPCLTYTPATDYVGMDTVCVISCSGTICDTTIFIIEVTPVNDPPVAVDDEETTTEDTPVIVDLVNNDYDLDGEIDSTSIVITTNPTFGTVTVNPDGTVEYTPNPGYVGMDQFTYSVCDTGMPVLCDTAVVTITINSATDTAYVSVPEDTTVTICTAILTNLPDPIDNIYICGVPMNGMVTPGFTSCLDYTPNPDFNGVDSMCVITCAGSVCDTTFVIIVVTPVNDSPVAVDDVDETDEDTPVTTNVLVNDSDLEGPLDTTSVAVVTNPEHGTVTVNPDGTITYTPENGFTGTDQYTYAVCDTGMPVLCDTAVVTITINPQADTVYTSVPEDSMINLCTTSSTNFENPITSISLCEGPDNGTATPSFLPCLTYTPTTDYIGMDTVCVISCSGTICDTTIFIIEVTPVNDPPVAVDDTDETTEDTPVTTSVLGNDTDLEGPLDTASVAVVTNPVHGTVTVNPDGTITYVPESGFTGTDQYTYMVCDTGMPVLCDTAIVTITITPAPDTTNVTTNEEVPVTVCTDSLTNFQNPITSVSICGYPANGALSTEFTPCVTYTPEDDFYGMDTFCIITCSGSICDTTYTIVTVLPLIDNPVVNPIEDICESEPTPALTGTSEAGSVINWYDAMNTLVGTGNSVVPTVTPGENCFYAVAVNTTFGLYSDTVEVCFNVDSLPSNVYAGPDDTLCGYHDYELQATGNGLQTFWTQIAGNSVGIASSNPNAIVALEPLNGPGTSNLYTFVWTNTNGLCVVRDTVNIVITNPHLTFAGNDTTVCIPEAGGSVNLNATLTPTATGYWEYNGNGNIAFADSTDPHTEVSGLIPYVNPTSTYRFYWYEVIGDCVARDEVLITVNEAPGLEVADSAIACVGSDFLLDANVSGVSQSSYSWRLNSPSGTILAWDEDVIVNPSQNTTYYVVASVGFGQNFCRTIDSIEVVVDGAPIAFNDGCYDVMEDDTLIGNTADWGANDDYSSVFGTVGYEVITASNLSPASSLEIDNTTGTYIYTPYIDMSGSDTAMIAVYNTNCPDLRDTFYVCFNVIPVVDSPIVAANDTDNVVAYGSVDIFNLDNDTLNDNAIETIITLLTEPNNGTVENNGDYVTYTSTTGTANIDSFMYSVCNVLADGETLCDTAWVYVITDGELYIPEGFTPNGDGVNDFFVIPDLNLLYPNATFKVFNRWGDEVWNSGGVYQNDFSGHNFGGTQLPDGTYFYIIELNDGTGKSKASYLVIYR